MLMRAPYPALLLAACALLPSLAAAQKAPPPPPAVAAAHARIEALQREVALLEALRGAQLRLIAWSEASAPVGRAPDRLPASLCAEPDLAAWCAALPATFGRPVR